MYPGDDFISFLAKIALLFAAGLVPLMLGGKIAGMVQSKIGDWTKGAKKSSMARSRGGSALAARRKAKETAAMEKATGRQAAGFMGWKQGASNKLGSLQNSASQKMGDKNNARLQTMKSQNAQDRQAGRQERHSLKDLQDTAGLTNEERFAFGQAGRMARDRLMPTTDTQKLYERKAGEMDFDRAQHTYHSLKDKPRTAAQEAEFQAAQLNLIQGGESQRLAYSLEEQAAGVHESETRQQALDRMPKYNTPQMVQAALKGGLLHVIENPNIQRGVAAKMVQQDGGYKSMASETITYAEPEVLKKMFSRESDIRAMAYDGDSRRWDKLIHRYDDLHPRTQAYMSQLVHSDPNLEQFRVGQQGAQAVIPPPAGPGPPAPGGPAARF